jgi:hypothetical protein
MEDAPACDNCGAITGMRNGACYKCFNCGNSMGLRRAAPVVVHGGGKAITKRMAEKGVKASFVKGLRVTDEQSMDVVEQVLNREVNVDLVQILEKAGCTARGIHGEDILRVSKHTERDRVHRRPAGLGLCGRCDEVDDDPILAYLHAHIVPVITPLGWGDDGQSVQHQRRRCGLRHRAGAEGAQAGVPVRRARPAARSPRTRPRSFPR